MFGKNSRWKIIRKMHLIEIISFAIASLNAEILRYAGEQ